MRPPSYAFRRAVLVGGVLLVVPALIAGSTNAVAGPDERARERVQVIRLVERIADEPVFDDRGAPGPGVGDRLIFSADLFDHRDQKVGRDGADCVVVRIDRRQPAPAQQVVECMVTVQLRAGQITFQGLAQGTENHFAVTGGTGAYQRARGEAHVIDTVPLSQADVTIRITG